ncbi:MAG: ABC transporter ATP-binding protein, partial [Firmicutes bacterium]|nr:ABC transporter ATP-binding protein [Bacillota bacterium]
MLELKDITKVYETGGETVHALKGIDLAFRESEFVSILGPSGCGKTTMLNIIGGLDRYTTGDLVINGKSTKQYKAKDWDTYRNHSVGFVFQSYNLIPHQTVLTNVELALTLSGVSKKARRKRAIEALKLVGLGDQLRKKPAEMSGGQMQRVAIARALVNDPEILLADEPTGALDTETSVQIMEILKEISKYKLVIMVTHNPDLANAYSTRIVRMIDGLIISDSMPLTEEERAVETEKETEKREKEAKKKHPKMKFATSFGLSLRNLITKKGRTTLTAFAGSIGIIGIALIFAVSHGMTTYINYVQEETLSSYPLALESKNIDLGSMIETFMGLAESAGDHDNDAVYQANMLESLVNALSNLEATENDLGSFKKYLEGRLADGGEDNKKLNEAVNGIQYGYALSPIVYTENVDGTILRSDLEELMADIMTDYYGMNAGSMMNQMVEMNPLLTMMNSSSSSFSATLWQQMLP